MDIQRKTLAIKKILVPISIVLIAIVTSIFLIQYNSEIQKNTPEESINFFKFNINTKNSDLIELDSNSIFKISGVRGEYIQIGNITHYYKLLFELRPENQMLYDTLSNTDQKTVVIYPIFTGSAYDSPGFYDYYNEDCDVSCLTVKIKPILRTEIGGNSAQILKLLNYNFLSDIDIDKNPEILENFDKVILLHNEYVTKREFDAITSHPNVIYLYPNALYAEVKVDYEQNTITLIRGHSYPEKEISNGFDWEFENTDPYEYDRECKNWDFYDITNGKMLNCYPEQLIYEDPRLLKVLKES